MLSKRRGSAEPKQRCHNTLRSRHAGHTLTPVSLFYLSNAHTHTHTHTHTGPSFDPILSLQQWWNVPCQQHCRVRFLGEALGSVGEYQLVRAPLARSWRLSPSARVGERVCACLIVYYSAGSVWWCVGTQSRCVFVCVCVCVCVCARLQMHRAYRWTH